MPARSRPARTAILVIHGIGEQNPYETLDSFARGLVQYFASSRPSAKVSLEPERINHGDWTEAAVHVDVNPADPRDALHLSLFEFYMGALHGRQGDLPERAVVARAICPHAAAVLERQPRHLAGG